VKGIVEKLSTCLSMISARIRKVSAAEKWLQAHPWLVDNYFIR
jgi:hypothetical protein